MVLPISHVTNDIPTFGSENRIFTSGINEKTYKLHVNLPLNYNDKTEKSFPVLYVLDGQWDFISAVSIYGSLHYDRNVPDLIIVGITYDGEDPDYDALRGSDFSISPIDQCSNATYAARFVNVLKHEIIPIIDNNYRIDINDRTIGGTSSAGLFTHYLLFNNPKLFNSYIIINPNLSSNQEKPFKYEAAYAKANDTLEANVYMVIGGLEQAITFNKMVTQIRSRNYEKLNFKSYTVEGMGHSGSKFEGYIKGMQHTYKKQRIALCYE